MSRMGCLDWQGAFFRSSVLRYCAVALLVVLTVLAGYFIRLQGPAQAHAVAHQLEQQLQESLAGHAGRLEGLGAEQEALELAEQGLREQRWRLAAGEGMSELLDALARSGQLHGLLFDRLDVLEEQQQPGYRLLPLEVQVRGRYPALRAWLEAWQQHLRLLTVPRLKLVAEGEQSQRVIGHLLLNAYHPGEALPTPASLAHEPARAALEVTAFDPFHTEPPQVQGGGLVSIALEQLEMVGSFSRGGQHQALLRSGARLFRVGEGERLGPDEGVVVAVGVRQVTVREQVYLAGAWQERWRHLVLGKGLATEIRDEAEAVVERDAGHADGRASDAGSGVSG